jgi:hypothetical protein
MAFCRVVPQHQGGPIVPGGLQISPI